MNNIVAFILAAFVLSGCSTTGKGPSRGSYREDIDALEKIEAIDGINQSEAYTIAKAFFWSNISGCGFPLEPTSERNYWVSQTLIGVAGLPGNRILIDKKTGAVTWGDKAKSITLEELIEAVKVD